MAITRFSLKNFKTFDELDVSLGDVNVLVGANAAGKSSFVAGLNFIQAIRDFGLANAISLQGGKDYLPNLTLGVEEPVEVRFCANASSNRLLKFIGDDWLAFAADRADYAFALELRKSRRLGYRILRDSVTEEGMFYRLKMDRKDTTTPMGRGSIRTYVDGNRVRVLAEGLPDGISVTESDVLPRLHLTKAPRQQLLIETPGIADRAFPDIGVYDFDPHIQQRAAPITGKAELEPDGSNLPVVLQSIIERPRERQQLSNLVADVLPFVTQLGVETVADKTMLIRAQETWTARKSIPASLLSAGTISVTALVVALYFELHDLTVVEEPERHLHPSVLGKLVEMFYDVRDRKQVIVTTHSPEIVKWARLEDLMLISRNAKGFSRIIRPSQGGEVRAFLTESLGVDDLYVQGILEQLAS
jgi:predicted ATPase